MSKNLMFCVACMQLLKHNLQIDTPCFYLNIGTAPACYNKSLFIQLGHLRQLD